MKYQTSRLFVFLASIYPGVKLGDVILNLFNDPSEMNRFERSFAAYPIGTLAVYVVLGFIVAQFVVKK